MNTTSRIGKVITNKVEASLYCIIFISIFTFRLQVFHFTHPIQIISLASDLSVMCFKHLHCRSLKHATKVNNIEHAVDLKINIDIHVRHRTNMNIPISWLFLMKFKLYNLKVSTTNILQTLTQTVLTNHRGGGGGGGVVVVQKLRIGLIMLLQ